ncbi:MAG: hypothetical protein AB7O92_23090 [Acidimicrobiia bacterium]
MQDLTSLTAAAEVNSEIVATLDLYTEDTTLSADSGSSTRKIREGRVEIRRPVVYALGLHDFPELMRRRSGVESLAFFLIQFPFDVTEVNRGAYESVRFQVRIEHDRVAAFSLHPEHVTTNREVERNRVLSIGPSAKLEATGELTVGSATFGRVHRYQELRPVITATGVGANLFAWSFQGDETKALTPGTRSCFAVLEMPRDFGACNGSFGARAAVRRRRFGILKQISTNEECETFRLRADGNQLRFDFDQSAGST